MMMMLHHHQTYNLQQFTSERDIKDLAAYLWAPLSNTTSPPAKLFKRFFGMCFCLPNPGSASSLYLRASKSLNKCAMTPLLPLSF